MCFKCFVELAFFGVDLTDRAVLFGRQHVLHLHRFDDGERLAGLDLLALLDDD